MQDKQRKEIVDSQGNAYKSTRAVSYTHLN